MRTIQSCKLFLAVSLALLAFVRVSGQGQAVAYVPADENLEARERFRDGKFGIFIHFGLYSMLGQGEWVMNNRNIDRRDYAALAAAFYPSRFDAAGWVSAIKAAGARYVCVTSRHHDGFSMFASDMTSYDIVDATPFKRDLIGELAAECHRQGIGLHLYYSHLDWMRSDYPQGKTGHGTGREPGDGDWESYYRFMNGQLTELLTRYGDVGAIWFDGVWDHPEGFDWGLEEQYALIHSLQPACLVGNNHHMTPVAGEDFQLFERDLPGENKAGFSGQEVSSLPLETCETMNRTWGYDITDDDYKSAGEIIRLLVRAAGKDANLLLNIGPRPDGALPDEALHRLEEVGSWLKVYGETIYGTRGGDIPPKGWGVTTRRGNTLYVHILDWQDRGLFLPLQSRVERAVLFDGRSPVAFTQDGDGVWLMLDAVPSGTDTVVELTLNP